MVESLTVGEIVDVPMEESIAEGLHGGVEKGSITFPYIQEHCEEVLLVSDGIVHPPLLGRFWLHRALRRMPGLSFQRAASLEPLPKLPLERYQAMVLFFHHNTLSPAALEALDRYVRQGGGILAIHSATSSFKQQDAYFEILGGQFTRHGPVQSFQVHPALEEDEVFGQIPAFEIRDELYLHEYDPANRVHFYAKFDGQRQPMVWTRTHGQGRIAYCSPGHCVSTMRHPAVQAILKRALAWTCGQDLP